MGQMPRNFCGVAVFHAAAKAGGAQFR